VEHRRGQRVALSAGQAARRVASEALAAPNFAHDLVAAWANVMNPSRFDLA
jgi:catalase (peroxidase I)